MRPLSKRVRIGKYLRGTLIAGDFVTLNIAYFVTLLLSGTDSAFASKLIWIVVNVSFIPSELLFASIHDVRIMYADRLVLNSFKNALITTCVLTTLLFCLDEFTISSSVCAAFAAVLFVCLSLWSIISRSLLKKARGLGLNFKRVVIIGGGNTCNAVLDELRSDAGYGYRMMGVFDRERPESYKLRGCYTGTINQVSDFIHLNKIDLIYYTLNPDEDFLPDIMKAVDEVGAEFVYVPKYNRFVSGNFVPTSIGNLPSMTHTLSPLHKNRNKFIKRVEDLVISTIFLIISPILFIPIAIAIKLTSKGPIIFKQKRTGIRGSEFVCYKFRTMKVNEDCDKVQATEDDPRKTALGDFLRKTSLDELPQFFNVFIGNMSVVGPRPHMVSHTVEYSALIDKYMVRHAVKPGITGWAQVNGYRGGTKQLWQMEKRVEYDVWYIRNWNIFLDIKIILLTALNGVRGDKNAY